MINRSEEKEQEMQKTSIPWAEVSWNPVRGCSRVSSGCEHCYAENMAARFSDEGLWGHGFAERTPAGPRWTRRVELIEEKLQEPLKWRKPRMIFVNSTSDLWHENLSREAIADVYDIMLWAPQHVYQVLTKRPGRRQAITSLWASTSNSDLVAMPHVWEGTSVENRDAIARIDHLRATPAAVRFLSVEPLLEDLGDLELEGIDWVIIGGESGPGARRMDPAWVWSVGTQARQQGCAVFMKQAGSVLGREWGCSDSKGADMSAWPEEWRVRQFPGLTPGDILTAASDSRGGPSGE